MLDNADIGKWQTLLRNQKELICLNMKATG